jgi:hypothetical protein
MTSSTSPLSPRAASAVRSFSSAALNGCRSFHSGCCGGQRLHPVQREQSLEIQRLLGPQGAVVVEHGDALGRWNVIGALPVGHLLYERQDGLLRLAVVPGRQRVGGFPHGKGGSIRQQDQTQEKNERPKHEPEGTMSMGGFSNQSSVHPCRTWVHAQTTRLDVYQ